MARLSKRVLSEDEGEYQQPARKASRNFPDADETPQSGTQPRVGQQKQSLQNLENSDDELPPRVTRGKGGRAAQLKTVGDKIRPDLDSEGKKKLVVKKTGTNVPKTVKENVMAPAAPKVRATKKKVPNLDLSTVTPLRKEDPPLGSGAPQPTMRNIKATNINMPFGFRVPPSLPVPHAQVPSQVRTSASSQVTKTPLPPPSEPQQRTNHRIERERQTNEENNDEDDDNDPPLPPKTRKLKQSMPSPKTYKQDRACSEDIPDSEEEHNDSEGNPAQSRNNGNHGNHREERKCTPGKDQDNPASDNNNEAVDEDQDNLAADDNNEAVDEDQDNLAADDNNEDQDDPTMDSDYLSKEYDAHVAAEQSNEAGAGNNENMDVDDPSPSEEEDRVAEEEECIARGLHKRSIHFRQSPSPVLYSVLTLHHSTNRKIRVPDPAELNADRRRGSHSNESLPTALDHHNHSRSPSSDGTDNENRPLANYKKRAKRNSKKDINKAPPRTQMGFYPPQWVNLIEFAKNHYRLYIFTGPTGFYERSAAALRVAFNSVMEGITVHDNDPHSEPLDQFYFDKQALSILIFEDGASYRGKMKIMGREVLLSHFKNVLRPPLVKQEFKSEAERLKKIVFDVEAMLFEGVAFLRGGFDINGKTKNFGHPVLADFCAQFFYSNKDTSLGFLFPAEFQVLPRSCLSLACACLVNCVREYKTGLMVPISFEGKVFGPVQVAMLGLIDELDNHVYHGPRLESLLQDIGWSGR
ncbi:hypothetical protein BDZ94DRAFT_772046 [Collybia nuda]|uniref:DUF6532 domain-containing protein n=1 Tax=Collybia nuda TaxID=64659 RepID=A0A9P5XTW7_9AGAR|nr:hypothetical protein BDZ94DRAFT_772046 [Collybia nuda]